MEVTKNISYLYYKDEHITCVNYNNSLDFGFLHVGLKAGDRIEKGMVSQHRIVMQIKGSVSILCDKYPMRKLNEGEMILIPCSTNIVITTDIDCESIIFTFDSPLSNCDKLSMGMLVPISEKIDYDFEPTEIKTPLKMFLELLIHYLASGLSCYHLHESKHKEFFLCLKAFYSKEEIAHLLHPIIGRSYDFKNTILQNSDKFISINDMIDATHMGRTQFYKTFKDEFGTTAKQWLLKQQVQKIKYAAAKPNVTVKELMIEFDFDGASHFTQFCKLHFGMTPSELIDSLKQN